MIPHSQPGLPTKATSAEVRGVWHGIFPKEAPESVKTAKYPRPNEQKGRRRGGWSKNYAGGD